MEARRVLAAWDLSAEAENTGAALAILTATPVMLAERRGEKPPDTVASFIDAERTKKLHLEEAQLRRHLSREYRPGE